jgi:phosphatidylglycerol:prolipoprotein diacylglycerol transferase
MFPILLKIGWFKVTSYGFMLAVSFLFGIYFSMYRAQKRGIDKNNIMDLSFIIVICAIIGSRLLYVVTHLEEFRGRFWDTINPIQSTGEVGLAGLSMLGGVLFVLASILIFCKLKHISILKLSDIMIPAFALGIALTRIGCFLYGCCFGKPTDLPWHMIFPLESPAGSIFTNLHIHPTQLYSSLYGLVIFVVILILDRHPKFDGFLLSVFFMLYGLSRFLVDFVRYYEESVLINFFKVSLTINQLLSLLMLITGFVLFFILKKEPINEE